MNRIMKRDAVKGEVREAHGKKYRRFMTALSVFLIMSAFSLARARGAETENMNSGITATTVTSPAAIAMPESFYVSPNTGGRSIKNTWSAAASLAYSFYSIDNPNLTNDTNSQSGSIGYLGIAGRYGLTEDLMLSCEADYLYGILSGNFSGTTTNTSYTGFPLSVNILIFIPMNSFSLYAGIGPVYLAGLQIKQNTTAYQIEAHGFGIGGQGIIGLETYLSSTSSIATELKYRHINLYNNSNKYLAPLNNLSMGLSLVMHF